MSPFESQVPGDAQAMMVAISNEMVGIYKDQFGRGPTKARTHWCGRDILAVVLENTLTTSERSLLKLGEHERLHDLRMLFQHAAEREFCETVERLTGRAVRSFTSGFDSKVDGLSVEFFVLYPAGYQGPSRGRPESA
jgi:uncharacterized protein YbcI